MPSRRPGASLDLGPLDLVCLEAALAADLIMASKSLSSTPDVHPLQLTSGPCSIEGYEISSRVANRYTRIFDAG